MNTPKEKLEAIITTHSYKGIKVTKEPNKDKYCVSTTGYPIPMIISSFILHNYNMTFCSADVIEFQEFLPIGVEINELDN